MSVQAPAGPAPPSQNAKSQVVRRSANYHPSIWGDHFVAYNSDYLSIDANVEKQIEELKSEVKAKFAAAATNGFSQHLAMIDAIQRLGLAYPFESEIEEILERIYGTYDDEISNENDNLHCVALRFRLFRQQGYNVPSDVFNRFKDNSGDFKESLARDLTGILSLYEAAQLRVHGEEILDEALAFTVTHLEAMVNQLTPPLKAQVINALKQPIHKGMPRLEARKYISIYQENELHDKTLLKLAKLDFNVLQKLHQKELSKIAKWWKDLDFATKMPFARDRVVECYFWILGVYCEPKYHLARRILTKVIAMTSVLDDIYDVYGTIDELDLLTKAIERWDMRTIDQFPEYMKIYYCALLDVYKEIEEEMANEGKLYRLYYAKEAMKKQTTAYYEEAKWLSQGYMPSMEEYMRVALVTSGYFMLSTTAFVGMGDIVTKETFKWVFSEPKVVKASETVSRLMDDMVSHKFEQTRGHVVSSVECYMEQYGVSEQEVHNEFLKRVADAWKDINQECLKPTAVPQPILMRVLNLTRVIDVIYKEEDGYTHAGVMLKDFVSSLLTDPVPM